MRQQIAVRDIRSSLKPCRAAFAAVVLISGLVNILYLTGSFFMLEVYDRVIPSRSVPTLVGLATMAAALYVIQGLLEIVRSRVLSRIGVVIDAYLSGHVFDVVVRLPLRLPSSGDALLPLRI